MQKRRVKQLNDSSSSHLRSQFQSRAAMLLRFCLLMRAMIKLYKNVLILSDQLKVVGRGCLKYYTRYEGWRRLGFSPSYNQIISRLLFSLLFMCVLKMFSLLSDSKLYTYLNYLFLGFLEYLYCTTGDHNVQRKWVTLYEYVSLALFVWKTNVLLIQKIAELT